MVTCLIQTGALDSSGVLSIITCKTASTAYDHYTDIYPQTYIFIRVQLSDALRSHVIAVSASQHPDARELQRELAAEAREVDAKRAKFWLTRPKADLLVSLEEL